MVLSKLVKNVDFKLMSGSMDVEVSSLEDNSKKCSKGSLFFAIRGTKENAEKYIIEAIKNGASVVVTQNEDIINDIGESDATIILVQDVRKIIGVVAKNFYSPNGYNFKIIGITGTNGKTTTSFMIGEAFNKLGKNVCVIGTSGIFVNGINLRGEALTTPDPIELQSLFAFLNTIYIDYVVMEVSAHALDLSKLAGVYFDYAIFTNLTEDHLDYFKTMENYGIAKSKLFSSDMSRLAIINSSDEEGAKLIKTRQDAVFSFGEQVADYRIIKKSNNSFKLVNNNKVKTIKLNMTGIYNFYNATGAIIVLLNEGVRWGFIKKYFKATKKIDGRYNEFKVRKHGKVVLDFAHTPDGLAKLLQNVRENMDEKGKIISVFGCGGDRDRDKRPIMGEISARYADKTIISIDNPRGENANQVMADVERGVKKVSDNYEIILPRSMAVQRGIEESGCGDVVVVSGKGTEPYYEVNGRKEFYREDIVIDCIRRKIERD